MLDFILDKNEFIKCRRDFIDREFLFWILFEIIGAFFVFIMTMVFIKANKNLNENFHLVTLSLWVIFSIICNRNNKKLIQKDIQAKLNILEERNMFGPCIINISSEGINVTYNNGITSRIYPWKIVREVCSFKKNVYIYISSFDYISIPKNAFKNEEERNVFLNKINNDRNDIKERLLSTIGIV